MIREFYCHNPSCDFYNEPQEVRIERDLIDPPTLQRDECACGHELNDELIDIDSILDATYEHYIRSLGNLETQLQLWRANYITRMTGCDSEDPEILAEAIVEHYEERMGNLETIAQRELASHLLEQG